MEVDGGRPAASAPRRAAAPRPTRRPRGRQRPGLFGRLLRPADVPARVARQLDGFGYDPGTVKVDWRWTARPWADPPPPPPGTVHVADSVAQMNEAHRAGRRRLPSGRPVLLVGQMTTGDPYRSRRAPSRCGPTPACPSPTAATRDAGDGGIRGVSSTTTPSGSPTGYGPDRRRAPRSAPGAGPAGPRPAQARAAQRRPGGQSAQQRHRPLRQQLVLRPVPALHSGPEDPGAWALPGLGLGAPRRRGPRLSPAPTPRARCCTSRCDGSGSAAAADPVPAHPAGEPRTSRRGRGRAAIEPLASGFLMTISVASHYLRRNTTTHRGAPTDSSGPRRRPRPLP